MKIKKFLAPSMQEALKMIKKEFGDDAIILSNKSVQLKDHPEWKNAIEVTAAIDKKDEIPSESFGDKIKKQAQKKPSQAVSQMHNSVHYKKILVLLMIGWN